MNRLRTALCLAAALLAGCAAPAPRPTPPMTDHEPYAQRAAAVGAWTRWGLTARLGIDDGQDGGSGRLDWRVDGESSTLDFRGALGRGAWRLSIDPEGATLLRADGSEVHANSIAELVIAETGLSLPVAALQWWVRGLPQPVPEFRWSLDDQGLVQELEQLGWQVHYNRYMDYGTLRMPRRLEATDGVQRVNLAVSRWWHEGEPGDA